MKLKRSPPDVRCTPKSRYRRALVPCPLWIESRNQRMSAACPLYPQKRTFVEPAGMSALCQKQTLELVDQHYWHPIGVKPRRCAPFVLRLR
jgi:hypothetical protein